MEKVPLKGLFSDGVWKCNCDPRLQAQRFQTKNGGQNHGRWFYTCQRPQPMRCDFFLWEDDAKPREMAAVLNNSRTEPLPAAPHTPAKNYTGGYITPEATGERSGPRFRNPETTTTPYTPTKSSGARGGAAATTAPEDDEEEEFFECSVSDEELSKTASKFTNRAMPPPETPRKAAKTNMFPTPGKRSYDEMHNGTTPATQPPSSPNTFVQDPVTSLPDDDDVFTTPSTTAPRPPNLFTNSHPPSPGNTSTLARPHDSSPGNSNNSIDPDLAAEILQCLTSHHVAPLKPALKDEIHAIGTRHSLHTRGVTKGRDISRAQIARNNETIAKLQADIAQLQAERETTKAVTRHLRRELGELEAEKEKGWK